jgi:NAD(P)-dependent dehydrogenase (short-subunit alcohol dehydrogenase family)
MGLHAITGGASGIGAAIARALRADGHDLIVVDLKDADIVADLGSLEGRQAAIDCIRSRAKDGLDGLVLAAGIGAHVAEPSLITRVNFFGSVRLVDGLEDLLAPRRGAIVLVASEAAFNKGYDAEYLRTLHACDEESACARIDALKPNPGLGMIAYGGGKTALVRWMRHRTAALAAKGVRINALAPGYTETALTEGAKSSGYAEAIQNFIESIPLGRPGRPEDIAHAAMFLLGEKADWVTGTTLHVDGGHDAVQRPDRVA